MQDPTDSKAQAKSGEASNVISMPLDLVQSGSVKLGPVARGSSVSSVVSRVTPASEGAEIRRIHIAPEIHKALGDPPVFETIRIVSLSRMRVALRRQLAGLIRKGQDIGAMPGERGALLETLERLYAAHGGHWPEVVVTRRSQGSALQTNFSVVSEMIYLGAHLSRVWDEGKEDPAYYVALNSALGALGEAMQSRFEAVPSPL